MRDFSLHILDIVQNSIAAAADTISIKIVESESLDRLTIIITDNGSGMSAEQVQKITDPFYTTRTTRKLGFGVPFFKDTAEQSGGKFYIKSKPGEGTKIIASMQLSHINRPPLGNMAETLQTVVLSNPEINFIYEHKINRNLFQFESAKFPGVLDETGNINFVALLQLKNHIEEGVKYLRQNLNH